MWGYSPAPCWVPWCWEFSLVNKRIASLWFCAAGVKDLTCSCLNIIQNTWFSSGDFVFLGVVRNCLPHLNQSHVLPSDFYAQHGLSITNTVFKRRAVRESTWYLAAIFGQRLLIDFRIISSSSMSWTPWQRQSQRTDCHLVACWVFVWPQGGSGELFDKL